MRIATSIFQGSLPGLLAFLLFFSGVSKSEEATQRFHIVWENPFELIAENAIYPDALNGLPKLVIPVSQVVGSMEIVRVDTFEYRGFRKIPTTESFSFAELRQLKERGMPKSFIEIVPVVYDEISEKHYLIRSIEVKFIFATGAQQGRQALRKASDSGNSILSSGEWYKIPVARSGVYKIDHNYLKSAGMNISAINPKKLKLFGNGGGMLPQKNSEERPIDLMENAIIIQGEADGVFNTGDFILFYGQGPDHQKLQEDGSLNYEKNFYSDTTYYFLTVSEGDGLRITERATLGNSHPVIDTFDDFLIYEKDEYNIISSGRMWFGERFDFTTTYDLSLDFTGLAPGSDLHLHSTILGQTYAEASINLFANSKPLGQQTIYPIAEGAYLAKGSLQSETFTLAASGIPEADKLTIRLTFNKAGSGLSRAHLDNLQLSGKRLLKPYGTQTHFRSLESLNHAISTWKISNTGSAFSVWDVTDPLVPVFQQTEISGSNLSFGAISGSLNEYIIFETNKALTPEKMLKVPNQNIRATPDVDFLIITHPLFLSEATRLADLRRNHDGLRTAVVTTRQIYNEFSSGKQDATALRDFIKHLYDRGSNGGRLMNVLLFGKGSYDYKYRIDRNTNFVPIYSSRNSVHPISSYSSDDYYTFMDEEEGEWPENGGGDYLMDIGVGRLPVKTPEEARIVVDKLIDYATNGATTGDWRNELVFIADDGDGNLHQRDAEKLATLVDTTYRQFNINKIYVDAFPQIQTSVGESAPEVNAEIDRSIHKGGLIFNFTGHGSPTRWTSETILNISSINGFKNKHRLPLFVTATCEFGRHENPGAISGAEYLLLNPNGGAIGLLTTSRPVYSSTNFMLNKAFYDNVFDKVDGQFQTIGEIFRKTKNQSINGTINRNFSLLGDPSMTLSAAKDEIRLTSEDGVHQPGDTIKALGKVKLKGSVFRPDGTMKQTFQGKVIATVFDKPSVIETLGHEDPSMTFKIRDNALFKGEATVKNGTFEIEFIVPKNIQYDFNKGKISTYAYDESSHRDAAGADIDFTVGGESDDYESDNLPPEITLFINDTSFIPGGITGPDVILVGKLQDDSGISTANDFEGRNLTAILDDTLEVNVNRYYTAATDTYKTGWVTYPFKDLSIGAHQIRLLAWDVHNNFSESVIDFVVVEGDGIRIENLRNYPNPFTDFTKFTFEHNRAGEDLEIMVEIYSSTGMMVKKSNYSIQKSPGRIEGIGWNSLEENGANLPGGIYIFRLGVRSMVDGAKNFANHKFIIIN